MSLSACIPGLVARGEISAEQGAEMESLFGKYQRHYARHGGPAAEAMASQATLEALERAARQRHRRELLQVRAQREAWLAMQRYGGGLGGLRALDPDRPGHLAEAAQALLARREFAPYRNVEHLARAIRGRAHAMNRGILQRHKRDILGRVRDRAGAEDLLREARGEASGNPAAAELARSWLQSSDYLRRRANAAGADIGQLEDWGVPQAWDSQKVADAGFDRFFADFRAEVDRGRFTDRDTGAPLDDAEFEDLARDIFATISSNGWSKRTPGGRGAAALAKRLGRERVIHFRDADAWLRMADKYGSRDGVFEAMMAHIDLTARDVALMEVLGPDPAGTIKWLSDTIEKQANLDGRASHRNAATKGVAKLERLFDTARGATSAAEDGALARFGGTVRAWQVATKLGSAALSTTSDQATAAIARRFNGLPVWQGVATQLRLLNPANAADRELAMRMMLVAEEASQLGAGQARMTGEELTGEVARRVAETTLRVSGLNALTQSGRWAFGMDFWSFATSMRSRSFDQLEAPFRNMFLRHGLGEQHWQAIRAAPLHEERGATWVLPENLASEGLADDIIQMVLREMDMAVPVAGLEIRAAIEGAAPKGTVIGEIVRTGFQFKAFPATIMLQQWRRTMALQGGWNRAKYVAQVAIGTTLMGALALQLKEISKGRDPRRLWDPDDKAQMAKFWGAALAQGGGLGIFGDFLSSSTNRFEGGITGTLAGPAFQTGDALANLLIGEPARALAGENTNPGRAAVRLLAGETPGIGSLWFTRLAYERLLLDTLQQAVDPNSGEAFRRRRDYAEDAGTDFWWEPGEGLDEMRAPAVGNMAAN